MVIDMVLNGTENVMSTEEVSAMFFGDYCSEDPNVRDENVTDYYYKISNHKLNVSGEVVRYVVNDLNFNWNDVLTDVLDNLPSIEEYDQDQDDYLDGIVFLVPDSCYDYGAAVYYWNYSHQSVQSNEYVVLSRQYKKPHTLEHEMIHLMGLPDVYGNVGLNPQGNPADAMMTEGTAASWSPETGWVSRDVPGVMKLFLGWIDTCIECADSKIINLPSYSKNATILIVYPHGYTDCNFVFAIEYLTADGTNVGMWDPSGKGFLRIWRVIFHTDGNGRIIGEWESPFEYFEAVHHRNWNNGTTWVLLEDDTFSHSSDPSSDYFTRWERTSYYSEAHNYTYQFACCATDSYPSGIEINPITFDGDTAKNLDDVYAVSVGNDTYGTKTWYQSPLNYAYDAQSNATEGALVLALYDYFLTAKAYMTNN